MIVIRVLGKPDTAAYIAAVSLIRKLGHTIADKGYHLQVAPLLTEIISQEQIESCDLGTLVFHPSPLPHGRGAAAIKHAYKRFEPITAATWFWANTGKVDSGAICEQEVIKIDYNLRPRDFYNIHIIPAMLRTLERCLNGLQIGLKRSIPQRDEYASFDYK